MPRNKVHIWGTIIVIFPFSELILFTMPLPWKGEKVVTIDESGTRNRIFKVSFISGIEKSSNMPNIWQKNEEKPCSNFAIFGLILGTRKSDFRVPNPSLKQDVYSTLGNSIKNTAKFTRLSKKGSIKKKS